MRLDPLASVFIRQLDLIPEDREQRLLDEPMVRYYMTDTTRRRRTQEVGMVVDGGCVGARCDLATTGSLSIDHGRRTTLPGTADVARMRSTVDRDDQERSLSVPRFPVALR